MIKDMVRLLKNKRILFFVLFFHSAFMVLFGNSIPRPKDNLLYTEFVFYKYAPYLKKAQIGEGVIAIDGAEKFLFKQLKPVEYTVKKIGGRMTYKKGASEEILIDASGSDLNFFFLFDGSYELTKEYNVIEKKIDLNTEFTLTPIKAGKFLKIIITAKDDIFISLELILTDKTRIIYSFKNTQAGIKPDAKIFE